ncbi:ferritin-like domain-containing protein [Chitinimonas sp. PSY-7]|uniref:PA2169 family four-helix-bundle protein n=1 Tax=Chitinimonas sp. PSY-7 TaxID=3459088 RepID=UPI0040402BD5
MNNKEIVDTLNNLIEASNDGVYGFDQCAQYASASELKNMFRMRAAECQQAVRELTDLVVAHGGKPDSGGTVSGAMHRGWVSIRSAVSANEDLAILEECEKGEDVAKAQYRKALNEPLPEAVRLVVDRQNRGVVRNHDEIKALRNRYRMQASA